MKLSKLKKMKMPEKKGEEMEEGMEMESSKGPMDPELEASEEELGVDLEGDMEAGEPAEHKEKVLGADLEAISDDELMAELKKRGLMGKMEEPSAEAEDLEEIYS